MSQREKLIGPLLKLYKVNTQKELCEKLKFSYSNFNRWYNYEVQNPSEEFSANLGSELLKVWSYVEVSKEISLIGVDPKIISESIRRDIDRAIVATAEVCSSHLQDLKPEEMILLVVQILLKVVGDTDYDSNDTRQTAIEIISIFQNENKA